MSRGDNDQMIDLKKPLEGVPGLLLLAALILFGATIGVTAALALSWVEMKDSIANFLGGVVGAGLGAALAVMGAVYVQYLQHKARRMPAMNEATERVVLLAAKVQMLAMFTKHPWLPLRHDDLTAMSPRRQIEDMKSDVEGIRDFYELPAELRARLSNIKLFVPIYLNDVRELMDKIGEADEALLRDSVGVAIKAMNGIMDEAMKALGKFSR